MTIFQKVEGFSLAVSKSGGHVLHSYNGFYALPSSSPCQTQSLASTPQGYTTTSPTHVHPKLLYYIPDINHP